MTINRSFVSRVVLVVLVLFVFTRSIAAQEDSLPVANEPAATALATTFTYRGYIERTE